MNEISIIKRTAFGSVSFYRRALAIALPVMAQLLIQNLVSLIDNFMVSGLGDIKMSGVNIAGQILFIFMVLMNTLCTSGGIFMAQYKGANDSKGMQQVFRFKMIVCLFACALFMLVCFVFPHTVLSLMVHGNSQRDSILEQGVAYIRIMGFTGLPMIISTVIASSMREIGEVHKPLIFSVIATLINTVGNWIFIYGNLGAPRLEVRGAAYATIIARTIEAIIYIAYIRKVKPLFYSRIRDLFKVKLALMVTILKKSGMILVSEMLWVLSETVTTALYNSRGGADIVSGMSASFAIANLFFISFSGVYTATSVIVGSTLGANRLDEARAQKNWMLNGAAVFGVFMTLLGLCSELLVPIVFANLSDASRSITHGMVFVMALYMPVWCYVNVQFAVSRTGGDAQMGMMVDGITNVLLVVPGMFFMTYATPLGPVAMYTIIKGVDFVKIAIATIWLKNERWVRNLAAENSIS